MPPIWIISLALVFLTAPVVAQKPLNRELAGVVAEQSSGNKPIADVELKSDWANPTRSVRDGKFTLLFQDIQPGEAVIIAARKVGWEVVNEEELRTRLPNSPSVKPLRVVMCRAGLLAQNRQLYFKVSTDYLTKRYEEQLAVLRRSGSGSEKRAAELEEQLKSQRQQARELADKYTRTNFDDITKEQREAFGLFQQGKIPEAIQVLERVNSAQIIAKAKQEKQKFTALRDTATAAIERTDSVIRQQAAKLVQQAEYYALNLQFDRAEKTYEQAASADTTNFTTIFSFAYFLGQQRQYKRAIYWYNIVERLVSKDDVRMARTLNNLGIVLDDLRDYLAARLTYEQALVIRERLAKANPAVYEPDLARTLNNLGVVMSNLRDYSAARLAYGRALEIRERLAKIIPAVYEPDLAQTLNNLGVVMDNLRDYPAARLAYERALEIDERLAKSNPAAYEPDLAQILNNLGNVSRKLRDYPAARSAHERVLEIRERLAKANPAAYEPDLAQTLNNLGIVMNNLRDYPAARLAYERALGIRERLARISPAAYEPDLAQTLNNLGVVMNNLQDYSTARLAYERALEIRERLAKVNPAVYEPDLANTLNNLGVVLDDLRDYPAGRLVYEQALVIWERLAKVNPAAHEPDLASTLNNLGVVMSNLRDYSAARLAYERVLEIRERLAKANPAAYEPDLASTLNNLGVVMNNLRDYPAARLAYERVLGIDERLAKSNPAAYEPDLARTLNNLGIVFYALRDYPAARSAYERALGIRERMTKANPTLYGSALCAITLGYCSANARLFEDSLSKKYVLVSLQKVKAAKSMAANYPGDSAMRDYVRRLQMMETYFTTADIRADIHETELAAEATIDYGKRKDLYQTIIANWQRVLTNEPGEKRYVMRLANAYGSLAWHCLFAKQFAEAETNARQGLSMSSYPRPDTFAGDVEWINTNLALSLLYQGKYAEAEAVYESLKDKPYNKSTYRSTFLADLDELEKAGVTHPDVAKIRQLLQPSANR